MTDKLEGYRPSVELEEARKALMESDAATRDLFLQAETGIEIEAFLRTPVGKYFASLAEIERAQAIEELIKAIDVGDENEVKRQRFKIGLCDQFRNWIIDGVNVGHEAARLLQQQDTTSST